VPHNLGRLRGVPPLTDHQTATKLDVGLLRIRMMVLAREARQETYVFSLMGFGAVETKPR
jgi:hypothetical protein